MCYPLPNGGRRLSFMPRKRKNYPAPVNIIYRGYKDPLIPLAKKYFGYEGVVLEDADTGRIQCHLCGKWFYSMGGHLKLHKEELEGKAIHPTKQKHLANAYKDLFGLMHSTALCSSEIRAKIIETRNNEPYWERKRRRWAKKWNRAGSHRGVNNKLCAGKKNKEGTCYLQLLDLIKKTAIKQGKVPSGRYLKGSKGQKLYSTIKRTFGSYVEALKLLKLDVSVGRERELSKPFLLGCLKEFGKINGRDASFSDFGQQLLPACSLYEKNFGSLKDALNLI